MFAESATRVSSQTGADISHRIRWETERRIGYYYDHPHEIGRRLRELDREWDIERTLEANASSLALAGVVLGLTHDRRWLGLSAGVLAFLLQHALQGWCPPLPVLRRLGFRTAIEIEQERYALKAIRGDFDHIAHRADAMQAVGLAEGS
ncbi:DUF2892 domain-containing protein [Roseitranquillus sediminis]|uniref:DUF2892 domain-containing protein n=1 Tax=Roseitranquillus sediminis TaxID=2809051 RepID=UPI001D0CCEBF|nr:DUF2892 domain-containing protein [Roseitranquillus sediminis]MBM9595242.1 DUF2892 domain-containing protein [Roseitranquillus sediminis]